MRKEGLESKAVLVIEADSSKSYVDLQMCAGYRDNYFKIDNAREITVKIVLEADGTYKLKGFSDLEIVTKQEEEQEQVDNKGCEVCKFFDECDFMECMDLKECEEYDREYEEFEDSDCEDCEEFDCDDCEYNYSNVEETKNKDIADIREKINKLVLELKKLELIEGVDY